MNMVIPAILEQDWEEIEKKIEVAQHFSNHLHIDFIDGVFAKNKTFMDPAAFSKYSKSNFLEAHLMVNDPVKYLEPLAAAGFKRFIGQIEMLPDQSDFVSKGEELGDVGLAIDGKTPIDKLLVALDDLDILLFMAYDAGFSGQGFNPSYLEKIKSLGEVFVDIEVDGGITDKTILEAKNAGANIFTANSFLFGSIDPKKNYFTLSDLVSETGKL